MDINFSLYKEQYLTIKVISNDIIDTVNELEDEVIVDGKITIVSADVYRKYSEDQVRYFMHKWALYTLPTTELINHLKIEIGSSSAIEICSGAGIVGKALGITCTDSYLQEDPKVKLVYAMTKQPTINYGKHVLKLDAEEAVKKLKPDVVVGCWVTQKYNGKDGSMYGPDESTILENCKKYVVVGSTVQHGNKDIFKHYSYKETTVKGNLSRSNVDFNRVWVFYGNKK